MTTKDKYMYGLGAVICIGFFSTLVFMIFDGNYKTEVNMVVGALIAAFMTVVGYFFGTSKSSQDKTELMNQKSTQ